MLRAYYLRPYINDRTLSKIKFKFKENSHFHFQFIILKNYRLTEVGKPNINSTKYDWDI